MLKRLIIAMMLIVAFTGSASAFGANIVNNDGSSLLNPTTIVPDTAYPYGMLLLDFNGKNVQYEVNYDPADGTTPGIDVVLLKTTANVNSANFLDPNVFTVKLPEGSSGIYTVRIDVREVISGQEIPTTYKWRAGATQDYEIPEFPTVALPVAAILGLAFVFMRRKE